MTKAEFIQQYILNYVASGRIGSTMADLVDIAAGLWDRIDSRYGS